MKNEKEFIEHFTNPVLTKKNKERIISWNNVLVKDDKGNIIGPLYSGEDITDIKKEEEALKEFLERIKQYFCRYIQDIDIQWLETTGEFKDFGIRF